MPHGTVSNQQHGVPCDSAGQNNNGLMITLPRCYMVTLLVSRLAA